MAGGFELSIVLCSIESLSHTRFRTATLPIRSNTTDEPSDRSLLRRIEGGEQDAATQLFYRYSKQLLALAKSKTGNDLAARFDPEDVVQSVFRTFFRRATTGCYDVPASGELWKLLLVLALNKVRRLAVYHRARKRNVRHTVASTDIDGLLSQLMVDDPQPHYILELVIESVLENMTTSERQIIELRIEAYTITEISKKTGRAKRTIERILQNFRNRLAEAIDDGSETTD